MKRQGSIARTCEQCGAAFSTWPYAIAKGHGRFCGATCNRAAQRVPPRPPRPLLPHPTDATALLVPLTRGLFATIDAADGPLIAGHLWQATRHGRGWRTQTRIIRDGAPALTSMHQMIVGDHDGTLIDHIDGDGLNNRRANLRPTTHAGNQQNQRRRVDCRSGFKGVHSHSSGLWAVRIKAGGTLHQLGYFRDAEEAALVYDDAARRFFGAFARVNFPRHGEQQA